jgi:flagellar protein FliS
MNPYYSYQQNSIANATREDILLKLYEGAILKLKKAKSLWINGNQTKAREQRSQVFMIISELDNTLDRENGPESLIQELDGLYAFILREINISAIEDDFTRLDTVQEILVNLYQGWKEAALEYKKSNKDQINMSMSNNELNSSVAFNLQVNG